MRAAYLQDARSHWQRREAPSISVARRRMRMNPLMAVNGKVDGSFPKVLNPSKGMTPPLVVAPITWHIDEVGTNGRDGV